MAEPEVLKQIREDAFYRQFIDKDSKEDIKLNAVCQGLAVVDQLKKLSEGISLLDQELQTQVLANHDNLLSQATWVEKLENILSIMQSHVQCLLTAVERLRNKVVEPFHKIEQQTLVLSRLQATSDLLRRIARTQLVIRRLNVQMQSPTVDITKASQFISELGHLCEDADLTGLETLEGDLRSVRSHRHEIESKALLLLTQGLCTGNHGQVGTAIQVFYNLETLEAAVMQVIDSSQETLSRTIKQALDIQSLTQPMTADQMLGKTRGGPGRAAMPTPGNASQFRPRLWTALERLFDTTIYTECKQVQLLQQVLTKKLQDVNARRDTSCDSAIVSNYWHNVNGLLAQHLSQAVQGSSFVKQALEGEYPKFLNLYLDLCKRLNAAGRQEADGMAAGRVAPDGPFVVERAVVEPFENAYLSRSVTRLLDPVHLMFSNNTVPSTEEVDALVRTISSELSVSLVDHSLSMIVAKNVTKTVRLFCLKCEQMVVTTGEATQVIDSSTPAQTLNVEVCNVLFYLMGQVGRVLANMRSSLPPQSLAAVQESLGHTDSLASQVVQPLLASVVDAVDAILLTMHKEDYSMASNPSGQCSLYMKELQGFLARAVSSYLTPFHNQAVIHKSSVTVAGRCIELFVRHACLVRPLGDGGRMKLAADFAQMELAISPLVGQLSDIGAPYRVLRSLRPLLFQTVEDIGNCQALGDVLPYSLVLMSLFPRGPSELQSPHTGANWSITRLSQWLDSHEGERDRLELVSGAIQKYQQTVRQKGDTTFHPVYPVMVSLLERGFKYGTGRQQ